MKTFFKNPEILRNLALFRLQIPPPSPLIWHAKGHHFFCFERGLCCPLAGRIYKNTSKFE
jgi:hypothetical protein